MPKTMGWKTITGAMVWAFGALTGADSQIMPLLPAAVAAVIQTIGTVLAVIGIRHAIQKGQ